MTPSLSTPTSTSAQDLSSPEAHSSYYLSYPKTPFLTLIGSSNFGQRSAERDLEGGLLITTFDKNLRGALKEEVSRIGEETEEVNEKLFARKDRKVSWGVQKAAKFIEGML